MNSRNVSGSISLNVTVIDLNDDEIIIPDLRLTISFDGRIEGQQKIKDYVILKKVKALKVVVDQCSFSSGVEAQLKAEIQYELEAQPTDEIITYQNSISLSLDKSVLSIQLNGGSRSLLNENLLTADGIELQYVFKRASYKVSNQPTEEYKFSSGDDHYYEINEEDWNAHNSLFIPWTKLSLSANELWSLKNIYPAGTIGFRFRYYYESISGKRRFSGWQQLEQPDFIISPEKTVDNGTLNWYSESSFNLDGESKQTISYYDGLYNVRQSLVSNHSSGDVIIQDFVYDPFGRKIVETLPSPMERSGGNQPGFSLVPNSLLWKEGMLYTYEQVKAYKSDIIGNSDQSEKVFNEAGSGVYYSPKRKDPSGSTYNEYYIPDAEGFPFTEVGYGLDGRNRVIYTSPAGANNTYDLSSENIYVDNISQSELDLVFGTEVGIAENYYKVISKDPNGQYTRSIYNRNNKIVLSSLWGTPPSIEEGDSYHPIDYLDETNFAHKTTFNLLRNNTIEGYQKSSEAQQFVVNQGNLIKDFTVKIFPEDFHPDYCPAEDVDFLDPAICDDCINSSDVCYPCSYKLLIEITDSKGELVEVIHNGQTVTFVEENFSSLDLNRCGEHLPLDITFRLNEDAPTGVYTVKKSLVVVDGSDPNEDLRISALRDKYINDNLECVIDINALVQTELTETSNPCVPAEECFDVCTLDYLSSSQSSSDLWDKINCQVECTGQESICDMKRFLMIMDVTPNGQYMKFTDESGQLVIEVNNCFNILKEVSNGNIPEIIVYSNAESAEINLVVKGWKYIIENWEDPWAAKLIEFHPEYSRYLECNKVEEFYLYEAQLNEISSYNDAIFTGAFFPLPLNESLYSELRANYDFPEALYVSLGDHPGLDPLWGYLKNNPSLDYLYQQFRDAVENYHVPVVNLQTNKVEPGCPTNLWTYAGNLARAEPVGNQNELCEDKNFSDLFPATKGTCNSDIGWTIFRSLYLAKRKEILQSLLEVLSGSSGPPNFCTDCPQAILHFCAMDELGFVGGQNPDMYNVALTGDEDEFLRLRLEEAKSSCSTIVDQWLDELDYCLEVGETEGVWPKDLDVIRAELKTELVKFCQDGFVYLYEDDSNNKITSRENLVNNQIRYPNGVSKYQPNFGDIESIDKVLSTFLGDMGLNLNAICNGTLISSPQPFGLWRKPEPTAPIDLCACTSLKLWDENFKADNIPADFLFTGTIENPVAKSARFDRYVSYMAGDKITDASRLIDCACGDSAPLPSLDPMNLVPTSITCSRCITCDIFEKVYDEVEGEFEELKDNMGLFPDFSSLENTSRVQRIEETFKYNLIREKLQEAYGQYKGGFVFNYEEYLDFKIQCGNISNRPVCNLDYNLVKDFENLLVEMTGNGQNLLNTACLCTDERYLNSLNNGSYSYRLAETIGLENNTPFSLTNCQHIYNGAVTKEFFNASGDNEYQISGEINLDGISSYPIVFEYEGPEKFQLKDLFGIDGKLQNLRVDNTTKEFLFDVNFQFIDNKGVISSITFQGKTSCFNPGECSTNKETASMCEGLTNWKYNDEEDSGCEKERLNRALTEVKIKINSARELLEKYFNESYSLQCLAGNEEFYTDDYLYNYPPTLYYYDQAGNLIKTVPPSGVDLVSPQNSNQYLASMEQKRSNDEYEAKSHRMVSTYFYNSQNELEGLYVPDHLNEFDPVDVDRTQTMWNWFDREGKIKCQQSLEQRLNSKYTYWIYDENNRIIETGEFIEPTLDLETNQTISDEFPKNISNNLMKSNVVNYYYNGWPRGIENHILKPEEVGFTVNRLLSLTKTDKQVGFNQVLPQYNHGIHFKYDESGNVIKILQEFKAQEPQEMPRLFFSLDYEFEDFSNQVNKVYYQKGKKDQFIHKYSYDEDGKLVQVETSTDDLVWETDVTYRYYRHGPLAREEIGEINLQGIDYAYTINGWLKAINGGNPNNDMGDDNLIAINKNTFCEDIFSMVLNYNLNDYKPSKGDASKFLSQDARHNTLLNGINLYNGNISSIIQGTRQDLSWAPPEVSPQIGGTAMGPIRPQLLAQFKEYTYDQLNRLKSSITHQENAGYFTNYTYDYNGNIVTLNRADVSGNVFDDLVYNPESTKPFGEFNNRLHYVQETANSVNGLSDFKEQLSLGDPMFLYDGKGRLVQDRNEGFGIYYDQNDKITRIDKDDPQAYDLSFIYDGNGNRIGKNLWKQDELEEGSFYVRDFDGNVMAVYRFYRGRDASNNAVTKLDLEEFGIFGSSRLGVKYLDNPTMRTIGSGTGVVIGPGEAGQPYTRGAIKLGNKRYEIKNHLGNVMAVITDEKYGAASYELPTAGGLGQTEVRYTPPFAKAISLTDYYPFGMVMPGRQFQSGNGYRYGFNGMEKDDEIKGQANSLDFGARMLDPRLGRWFAIDPQAGKQPGWSPYKAFLDNPILYVDPDGETEYITVITQNEKTGETTIETMKANRVMTDGVKHMRGSNGAWHYENDYYDYATTTLRTIGADGKVTQTSSSTILYNKYKDSDNVWFGGNKAGDTKLESWTAGVPKISDFGGLTIYGSASSSEDSPGTKTTGIPWGSFDFGEFSEIMGLVSTAMATKGENSLGADFSGTKLAEIADKTKEVFEYNNTHKVCNNCNKVLEKGEEDTHPTLGEGTRDTLIMPLKK